MPRCLAERLFISGGGDDAFVLKSDYSVGRYINCENVTVPAPLNKSLDLATFIAVLG